MELADAVAPTRGDGYGNAETSSEGVPQTPLHRAPSPPVDPDRYVPRTLLHDLESRGRLPFAECLEIGLGLANALKHLHGNGLVHRDIKPSNIIFVNGVPKLADIDLVADCDATLTVLARRVYTAGGTRPPSRRHL